MFIHRCHRLGGRAIKRHKSFLFWWQKERRVRERERVYKPSSTCLHWYSFSLWIKRLSSLHFFYLLPHCSHLTIITVPADMISIKPVDQVCWLVVFINLSYETGYSIRPIICWWFSTVLLKYVLLNQTCRCVWLSHTKLSQHTVTSFPNILNFILYICTFDRMPLASLTIFVASRSDFRQLN